MCPPSSRFWFLSSFREGRERWNPFVCFSPWSCERRKRTSSVSFQRLCLSFVPQDSGCFGKEAKSTKKDVIGEKMTHHKHEERTVRKKVVALTGESSEIFGTFLFFTFGSFVFFSKLAIHCLARQMSASFAARIPRNFTRLQNLATRCSSRPSFCFSIACKISLTQQKPTEMPQLVLL